MLQDGGELPNLHVDHLRPRLTERDAAPSAESAAPRTTDSPPAPAAAVHPGRAEPCEEAGPSPDPPLEPPLVPETHQDPPRDPPLETPERPRGLMPEPAAQRPDRPSPVDFPPAGSPSRDQDANGAAKDAGRASASAQDHPPPPALTRAQSWFIASRPASQGAMPGPRQEAQSSRAGFPTARGSQSTAI